MPAAIKLHTRRILLTLTLLPASRALSLLAFRFFSAHLPLSALGDGEEEGDLDAEARQVLAIDTQNDRPEDKIESDESPSPSNSSQYQPDLDPV